MAEELSAIARDLREAAAAFDPALLSGEDCAALAEELAVTEKACAAARVRAAARAADCRAHEQRGFSGASDWLARISGSSVADARSALATAGALERCEETREALVRGEVSLAQAEVIVEAEAACAGAEAELLALARRSDLAKLKDEGRRRRLASLDVEELHRRQHQAREWRQWRDDTGMVRMAGALPPELGVPFANRLEAETDRIPGPPDDREATRPGPPTWPTPWWPCFPARLRAKPGGPTWWWSVTWGPGDEGVQRTTRSAM